MVFKKLNLRTTLVVPFVLQVVTAVGLVGYLSYQSGQQAVSDLSSQLRGEITARIKRELEGFFLMPQKINAQNVEGFDELDFDNPKNLGALYQQMVLTPYLLGAYCSREKGGEFLSVGGEVLNGPNYFWISNASTNHELKFYGIDKRGNRLPQFMKGYGSYDPRTRPWYKAAVEKKAPTWTEMYLDFTTSLPTISAIQPVLDKQGKILGVCGADVILTENFRGFLTSLKIGKTGRAFVIDRKGQMISNSTKESLVIGKGDNARLILATESKEPLIHSTADYLKEKFTDFQKIQGSHQLDFDLNGQRQFVQVVPFSDGKGLDWLIVVTMPESDFMEQINANRRTTIALCAAALGIATLIGILTARWITRPIIKVTKASDEMAKGSLDQSVETKGIIELEKLAGAFNTMAGQLKELFETLEDKVKERTAELAEANDEIIALNERLKEDNLRMSAELDIVRQMQQMILPRPEELENIQGLDIAGYMDPADEVGGDYYDVLNVDGVITIGIGDVTGHGLESGILMLMAQTCVRTLKEIREVNTVRFLGTLNRTIYKNVQRMNSEKNLTLAILNYADGRISISGQHEETIVVRANGNIERIDTMSLGFPIGLDDDIEDFVDQITIDLSPGDGVVLYTDGVTEAKDMQKKQYGIERLCEVIHQNWHCSAQEVKQAVIQDLRQYIGQQKVFDDITLLVLKHHGNESLAPSSETLLEAIK